MATGAAGMLGGLLSYFTRHRTAANLLLVILIVAGLSALPRIRAQFFPDIVIDSIRVSIEWNGAGADDVDNGVVQLVEPALMAVEGVIGSSSTATEGRATISLEFEPGWDMARAAEDVQTAADSVGNLPEGAEDPNVRRGAWRDLVTNVVIAGPVGLDQLSRFADELIVKLFGQGVTKTTIMGVAAPETIVEVTSVSLIENQTSLSEIAAAISREAQADPTGDVGDGSARVRTGVAKRTAPEIAAIVLRSDPDGSTLTIGDVAKIRVEGIDRDRAYFVGENPAIMVRVERTQSGDAIGIQQQVEDAVKDFKLTLPPDVNVDLTNTRAEAITARLNLLLGNGAMGLGLVLLLLFLFLNARIAFWVAAGIPVAMMATIAIMYLAGMTFNMISLFGLIITLGIVVDDAIVVGEHADFRARRLGEKPVEAAENAARRMFAPVFSATVTTIIAFWGLVIIGGRFGSLIADIPITVIVVLSASLLECFLILPNHMRHALTHSARQHWYDLPSRIVNRGFTWFRDKIFRWLMAGVLWARYPVLAFAVGLLAMQVAVFVRGDLQFRFFNAPEQGIVSGNFAMAPGATRDDSLAMMHEMQRAAEVVGARYEATHGANPIAYVIANIGGGSGRGLASADTKESWQLGSISIELIDADLRPYSSFAFVGDIQQEIVNHPMAETVSFRSSRRGPGGDSLDVELFGANAQTLKAAAEALKSALSEFPEVSGLDDSLAYDKDELVLELTPQGQALGLTIDGLGRVLRDRLNGIEAANFPEGTRSASIRVQLPKRELTADFLDHTQIRTPEGGYVMLADIVSVTSRQGFSTVRRENGVRLVNVTGDISEDDAARADAITIALEESILPRIEEEYGVSSRLAGLAEQQAAFLNDALISFLLCLLGIYLTLAWIFSSWTRPLVVMAIIPFGLTGAIYGHVQWGVPLSMFSVIGLIGMTGIIINDSIVLVTTIDEYAASRGLFPAIIDGVADRLRPVLLTTATTVLGLSPLLFENSQDAQFMKPTVVTLVYGLGFGMVLVLMVAPAVLAMQLDVRRQVSAALHAIRHPMRTGAAGVSVFVTTLAVLAWFAATIGTTAATGSMAESVSTLLPTAMSASPQMPLAFALFVAGTAGGLIAAYVLAGLLVFALRNRAASA